MTLTRKRLVHKLIEAYVDWREACTRVDDAYRSWARDTCPRDRVAYGLYMAALDAEQQAADIYAGLVRRASRLAWSDDPAAEALRGLARGCGWP
jgi:hypothetical protein